MTPSEGLEAGIREWVFSRERIATGRAVGMKTLWNLRTDIRAAAYFHGLFVDMSAEIACYRGKQFVEVKYPLDWWQSFKERWFPKWVLRRWPVRYHYEKWEACAMLPDLEIPKTLGLRWNTFLEARQ